MQGLSDYTSRKLTESLTPYSIAQYTSRLWTSNTVVSLDQQYGG